MHGQQADLGDDDGRDGEGDDCDEAITSGSSNDIDWQSQKWYDY